MLAESYLKARYFQGVVDECWKWRGWLERKATAEREGRPFDEPPPDALTGKGDK